MNKITVIFVRYLGVIFSALIAFLSIKVFLDFEPQDGATLFAIIGWMLFIPILQFGYGKPSYALIRQKRQNREDISSLLHRLNHVFSLQGAAVCFVMMFLSYFLAITQNYSGNKVELIFFTMGLSSIGACMLFRDLAYALDLEIYYECLETFRRFTCTLIYAGIYFGIPFWSVGILGIIVGIGSFCIMSYKIFKFNDNAICIKNTYLKKFIFDKKFIIKTRFYLGFTFSELAFYNIPLIFFTIWPSSIGMAYYGIWSKFLLFIVLPFRIFIDTQINQIVKSFFDKDNQISLKYLKLCIVVSITMLVFCISFLFLFGKALYAVLGAGEIIDSYFLISLLIWGFVNIFQHTFGSFVLSYGGGFQFSLFISLFGLILMASTFYISYNIWGNVGKSLILAGLAYSMVAVSYMLRARAVFRGNGARTY